jgi:hypothetical protein
MRCRFSLAAVIAAVGLLMTACGTSTARAQDYYTGYGYGYYNGNNYTYAPYTYGGYGYQAPVPYAPRYVYQQSYPYYGNYYYGAYPQYGYAYGGPIIYGRYGRGGRAGFRFGWW